MVANHAGYWIDRRRIEAASGVVYILAAPFQGVWGKTCESSVTKLIVKLKIALAVLGIISMSVDIVVNLKGILTLKTTLFGWKKYDFKP